VSGAEDRLDSVLPMSPGAAMKAEGGRDYVYLPLLRFRVGEVTKEMDALLCLTAEGAYLTRLFLAQPIPERPTVHGASWIQPRMILGRMWHTWSWQDVPASLPLIQVLRAHLKALQ
jgi:hypothetical protein